MSTGGALMIPVLSEEVPGGFCHAGPMSLTLSPAVSAAVSAAVAVAARIGVACDDPEVLADGANIVVHLKPSPVVAKVAASTPVLRGDAAAWLQRELDVVLFLAEAGIPVMAPARDLPATVHHGAGHVMSFWTYLPPSGAGLPDEDTIGAMLRDLHAALRDYPDPQRALAPLEDIPVFLARPQTILTPGDAELLTGIFRRLTGDLAATPALHQSLHGDAGIGNLMAAGGGWVWHDFEDTCSGPVAWDLAASTASPRLDRARILAAYGEPADDGLLRGRGERLVHGPRREELAPDPGVDRAGADGVDPDPPGRQFEGERRHHGQQGAPGRGGDRAAGHPPGGAEADGDDDHAAFADQRERLLQGEELALEVDGDQVVERGLVDGAGRLGPDNPRVEEQQVERAEALPDLGRHPAGVGQRPGVGAEHHDLVRKLLFRRGDGDRILPGHHHPVPALA
jgi:hypothetical protein